MGVGSGKTRELQAQQLGLVAKATMQHLSKESKVVLNGVTYTPASLAKAATDYQTKLAGIQSAAAALKQQRDDQKSSAKAVRGFLKAVNSYAVSRFTPVGPELLDFGFSQEKVPAPRTGKVNVAAAQRAQRSRKITGTLGKKQKRTLLAVANLPADLAGSAAAAAPSSAGSVGDAAVAATTSAAAVPAAVGAPVAAPVAAVVPAPAVPAADPAAASATKS